MKAILPSLSPQIIPVLHTQPPKHKKPSIACFNTNNTPYPYHSCTSAVNISWCIYVRSARKDDWHQMISNLRQMASPKPNSDLAKMAKSKSWEYCWKRRWGMAKSGSRKQAPRMVMSMKSLQTPAHPQSRRRVSRAQAAQKEQGGYSPSQESSWHLSLRK